MINKAEKIGYKSKIISAGRNLNEYMPKYICERLEKIYTKKNMKIDKSKILIMGITFKENCNDARNSKMIEVYNLLVSKGAQIDVCDPNVSCNKIKKQYGIHLIKTGDIMQNNYDCILIGVAHDQFKSIDVNNFANDNNIVFDIKGIYEKKYERL